MAPKPQTSKSTTSSISNLLENQIEVYHAYIKCMIDDHSGILAISEDTPDRLCYFELDDLNVKEQVDKVDAVMMMNRLNGVRVQLQARLFDDIAPVQYVAHVNGVQIVGDLPAFLRHVHLKRGDISKVQCGHKCEKVYR